MILVGHRDTLPQRVNAAMRLGWVIAGGPYMDGTKTCQAMVRQKPELTVMDLYRENVTNVGWPK
jgi:hypothetical protein